MAEFRWRWPSKKLIYQNIVRRVDGVGASTFAEAETIAGRIRPVHAYHSANNAARRLREGKQASYIEVKRGSRKVDAFVNLVDPDNHAIHIEASTGIMRGGLFG